VYGSTRGAFPWRSPVADVAAVDHWPDGLPRARGVTCRSVSCGLLDMCTLPAFVFLLVSTSGAIIDRCVLRGVCLSGGSGPVPRQGLLGAAQSCRRYDPRRD
jgi:hypothetical protein